MVRSGFYLGVGEDIVVALAMVLKLAQATATTLALALDGEGKLLLSGVVTPVDASYVDYLLRISRLCEFNEEF